MDSSLVTLFLIIGLLSGTAMGILTWRLPAEILRPSSTGEAGSTSEFTFSGSRCCQCQTPLFWYDTVPLLGWMLLKGKCRHCGQPVSTRYPLLEGLCAMMAVICYALHPASMIMSLALFLFFWFVLALSVIDLQHYLYPTSSRYRYCGLACCLMPFLALFPPRTPLWCRCRLFNSVAALLAGPLNLSQRRDRLRGFQDACGSGRLVRLARGTRDPLRSVNRRDLLRASAVGKKGHFGDPIPFGPALALSGWGCFCWATL
jgi:leader peptidase (prepilin peptidase)/N-methyltransferase